MNENRYNISWRHRIKKMRVKLYDIDDKVISNPSGSFGLKITYPMIFRDVDQFRNEIVFSATRSECRYDITLVNNHTTYLPHFEKNPKVSVRGAQLGDL